MLHYSDRDDTLRHLNIIWDALHMIPLESDPDNMPHGYLSDDRWSDITTAMAWITEDLDVDEDIDPPDESNRNLEVNDL